LATIKDILGEESTKQDTTPEVKYQNPDAWTHSLPPATYERALLKSTENFNMQAWPKR
jgi:hypothetical protein